MKWNDKNKQMEFTVYLSEEHLQQLRESIRHGDMFFCERVSYDIMNDIMDEFKGTPESEEWNTEYAFDKRLERRTQGMESKKSK